MKLACLLLFLILSSSSAFGGTGEACRLLENQESFLSEAQEVSLERDGFVIGTAIPETYPNIVVSSKLISDCDTRYMVTAYFSNKISGEERFPIQRPLSVSQRKVLSETVCRAFRKPQLWTDGVSHEVFNTVSSDIFPEFFDCITRRVSDGETIGPELFTETAFAGPSERLLSSIRRQLEMDRTITSDQVAMMLFVLKNGGRLPREPESMTFLQNSRSVDYGEIDNEEIIKRALTLLDGDESVSLSRARQFQAEIWGLI